MIFTKGSLLLINEQLQMAHNPQSQVFFLTVLLKSRINDFAKAATPHIFKAQKEVNHLAEQYFVFEEFDLDDGGKAKRPVFEEVPRIMDTHTIQMGQPTTEKRNKMLPDKLIEDYQKEYEALLSTKVEVKY